MAEGSLGSLASGPTPSRKNLSTALASAEWLLLLALVAVFVWRGFLPGWRTLSTDFPNYYMAARVYRQVYPLHDLRAYLASRIIGPAYPLERLYDWTWFQRQDDHAGVERRIIAYVPLTYLSAMPVLPLSYLSIMTAKRVWLVLNLLLLGLTILLMVRMTSLGWRRTTLLAFLTLDPLRTNFLYGQEHVFLLFLLTLAAWLYFQGWPASSGAALALAAGLKIYPALFFIYFLRKKHWRALAGLALGGAAVAATSMFLFGFEANRAFLTGVMPWPLRGEVNDPYSVDWNSATALLHRLFIAEPELNPHPLIHAPVLYGIFQPLFQALLFVPFLWGIRSSTAKPDREKFEWGCFVFLLLILSTNPTSYHHCVMILTGVLVADFLLAGGVRVPLGVFAALYGLACFPFFRWVVRFDSGWMTFLAFPRLYTMLLLWGFLLWQLTRARDGLRRFSFGASEARAFACIFLALVAIGVVSNLRHLRGLYQNYASRVMTVPGGLFASEPAVTGDTLLFTTMGPRNYTTAALVGGRIRYADFGGDAFHPTLAAESREAYVEVAGVTSRVLRFSLDGASLPAGQPTVVAENAEKPALSPDGRWLLFIREERGRGSLWIKGLNPDADHAFLLNKEWQWVGSDYDVLEVTVFPDNAVVFAASPDGQPKLYIGRIHTPRFSAARSLGDPIRYPAASPDGQWLAYSREEKGNWQLWVIRLSGLTEPASATDVPRRLTNAQCNCTHPAWLPDSKTLIYATDCGRGLGLTALARIPAVP